MLQRKRPLQPPMDTIRPPKHSRPLRDRNDRKLPPVRIPNSELERYRLQVGREHGANAGHIVGAIANEAGIDSRNIGRIELFGRYSTVDLPRGMPKHILMHLQKVRIFQQKLAIQRDNGRGPSGPPRDRTAPHMKRTGPTSPSPFRPAGSKPNGSKGPKKAKPKR
jgi:ATP-dependent RNA helicase DeaD